MGVNPIPDNTPPYVQFAYYPSPPFLVPYPVTSPSPASLNNLPETSPPIHLHRPDCIAHAFPIASVPISWSAAGRYVPASANQKEEKTWTISILEA